MPSLLPLSSSTKEQRNGDGTGSSSRSHLFLNVYDLTPINNYLYWFGLGIFHTGIEVHGMEYGFGAHDYASSGVFEVEPKGCPGFVFRRSVWLGVTDMSRAEFRMFIEQLSGKYYGDTYHLIVKNCNHFTDDVCMRLTGKPIPGWVNRLARLGSFCNCLLSENIQVSAVRHLSDHPVLSGLPNDNLIHMEWKRKLLEIMGLLFSMACRLRRKRKTRRDITKASTATIVTRVSETVGGHTRVVAIRRVFSVRRPVEVRQSRKFFGKKGSILIFVVLIQEILEAFYVSSKLSFM